MFNTRDVHTSLIESKNYHIITNYEKDMKNPPDGTAKTQVLITSVADLDGNNYVTF